MEALEAAYYLPKEITNTINFPELRTVAADVSQVVIYSNLAQLALSDYQSGKVNRINLNSDDLQSNVNTCRGICETLGKAPNVCYDILLSVRAIQMNLQNLIFLKRKFGDTYVGVPTNTTGGTV